MSVEKRYEERPCFRCDRGRILHATSPTARPRWKPCPYCEGTGVALVFLYPSARGTGAGQTKT